MSTRYACLAAVVLASCKHGCGAQPVAAALYASDEEGDSVAVMDPATNAIVAHIAVGKRPRGLRISRDGSTLYVALSGSPRQGPGVDEIHLPPPDRSADGIGVVDLATRKLVRTIASGQDPENFDLSPDDKLIYVSNEETEEMTVVDATTGSVRGRVHVGKEPEGVGVRPDGKVVFVTAEADNRVAAIDAERLTVLANVDTGPRPRGVVFTPDGASAFVTNELGRSVTVIDAKTFKVVGDVQIRLDSPRGHRSEAHGDRYLARRKDDLCHDRTRRVCRVPRRGDVRADAFDRRCRRSPMGNRREPRRLQALHRERHLS